MKYFKRPVQRIGWLFVLAAAAGVSSVVVMSSTLGGDDLLAAVNSDQGSLILGEMLIFVMVAAMVRQASRRVDGVQHFEARRALCGDQRGQEAQADTEHEHQGEHLAGEGERDAGLR